MMELFHGMSNLESLDISSFDTSKVINMHGMFDSCYRLKELNITSFNTSSVFYMGLMFNV